MVLSNYPGIPCWLGAIHVSTWISLPVHSETNISILVTHLLSISMDGVSSFPSKETAHIWADFRWVKDCTGIDPACQSCPSLSASMPREDWLQ